MQDKINLALIYGSARQGRMCDRVTEWAAAEVERAGAFVLDRLDPADPTISAAIHGEDRSARTRLKDRVDAAEAFLVVVPEYNHSFPAPLKALIDAFKTEVRSRFGEDGRLHDPEAAQYAAAAMLAHLTWWAQTLKDGRQARAYGEIAA